MRGVIAVNCRYLIDNNFTVNDDDTDEVRSIELVMRSQVIIDVAVEARQKYARPRVPYV